MSLASLTFENPHFLVYCRCVLILMVKQFITHVWVAKAKIAAGTVHAPEDKPFFDMVVSGSVITPKSGFGSDHPDVKRVYAVIQNDFENIPFFYILGLLNVIIGGGALQVFYVFTFARIMHTLYYINGVSFPFGFGRGFFFGMGVVSLVTIALPIASKVFFN